MEGGLRGVIDLKLVFLLNTLSTRLSISTSQIGALEMPDSCDFLAGRADWAFFESTRSGKSTVFQLTMFLVKNDTFLINRLACSAVCKGVCTDQIYFSDCLLGEASEFQIFGSYTYPVVTCDFYVFEASPSNSTTDLSCSLRISYCYACSWKKMASGSS